MDKEDYIFEIKDYPERSGGKRFKKMDVFLSSRLENSVKEYISLREEDSVELKR